METIQLIDSLIEPLINKEHLDLFDRWAKEYTQRFYEVQRTNITQRPKENTSEPGFEKNLLALLFNQLKVNGKDPHSEWPYASQIDGASEKADLHIIETDGSEVWFELGMYANDACNKYEKDFKKLLAVVGREHRKNIGVLIHFEIYLKNQVEKIFRRLEAKHNRGGLQFHTDIKRLEVDMRLVAVRLIIEKRAA